MSIWDDLGIGRKRKKVKKRKSLKSLYKEYEKETGNRAIYRGDETTLGFKKWIAKKKRL